VTPKALAIGVALLCGLLAAHAAMPSLFRAIPSDVSRIGVILDALRRRDLEPSIVVFGSSVIASAIDVARLRDSLPGRPLALNLSSAQQSLTESYLLYQELPPTVRTIVQTITPRELMNLPQLGRNKFNAYYLFGYRPDERTRRVLDRVLGDDADSMISASDGAQRFLARWSVHQALDTGQWRLFWATPGADRWARDLFFSNLFSTRLPQAEFDRSLRWWVSTWTSPSAEAESDVRFVLDEIALRAASDRRRLIVLVPPTHPAVRQQIPAAFLSELRSILGDMQRRHPGVAILDQTDLLPDEGFRDCIHVLSEGSPPLTDALAELLRPDYAR